MRFLIYRRVALVVMQIRLMFIRDPIDKLIYTAETVEKIMAKGAVYGKEKRFTLR